MALTQAGTYKAASLLMGLDATMVSELLEGLSPEEIQEVAMAMAQIEASGGIDTRKGEKILQEFCTKLRKSSNQGLDTKRFFNETLVNILDKEKVEKIQSQVKDIFEKNNPFKPILSATPYELVLALEKESASVIALILSELEPKKVQEILPLLDKELCSKVVWAMTKPVQMRNNMKENIASVIGRRLEGFKGETVAEGASDTLRNLAIVLSESEKEMRDQMIEEIKTRDEQTASTVRDLMVTWEDIPNIANMSLQKGLQGVDNKNLAIALHGADEEIEQKIRSNISERAAAALDEEKMLMQPPLKKEVLDAREEVVKPLRKASEEGTLRRME